MTKAYKHYHTPTNFWLHFLDFTFDLDASTNSPIESLVFVKLDMRAASRLHCHLITNPQHLTGSKFWPPSTRQLRKAHRARSSSAVPLFRINFFFSSKRYFRGRYTMETQGPWGAWQVQSSKFTQLVVDSMKKLWEDESVSFAPQTTLSSTHSNDDELIDSSGSKISRRACRQILGQRRSPGWQFRGTGPATPRACHKRSHLASCGWCH